MKAVESQTIILLLGVVMAVIIVIVLLLLVKIGGKSALEVIAEALRIYPQIKPG